METSAFAPDDDVAPELLEQAVARLEILYAEVARTWPGFIARSGQYQMMHAALRTFLRAKAPPDEDRQGENLAELEAGTGTGKTVAYCLAAIVASELLGKTVIVSTATVALQEQLFHKDLPRLAQIIPELRFDILKGRGRYICENRLEGAISDDAQDSLLEDSYADAFPDLAAPGIARDRGESLRWFTAVAKKLQTGKWDGDIDSLVQQPTPQDWRQVQASANACAGARCEYFRSCAFFRARRQAATATLQVANHALILATLQTDSTLIDPGNTLFVFDEAHHLPDIAAEQFSYRARLGASARLLAGLRTVAMRQAREMPASSRPDPVAFAQDITRCTEQIALFEAFWTGAALLNADSPLYRFAQGRIPDELIPECEQLALNLRSVASVVAGIAAALQEPDDSLSPDERAERARAGVELGVYLARLDTLQRLFTAWATHDKVPWAKWMELAQGSAPGGEAPDAWFCASPMTAAQLLSRGLWRSVGAAVCTSATLTACGSFDFFDRLSGLNRFPKRLALVVASPFDYATQGELRIPLMKHTPKGAGYSDELCALLPTLLREHGHGQLVLFTSRRQMQACHAALPGDLAAQVQVQGARSRTELLREHGRRVASGERSIIFGLQSFGEGIDLPGQLCEHVVIDKLPFTPPTSPVDEALAEWLSGQGRDPFAEISVPRAGMKLAQWAGRGVRTVTDRAVITVCDTRLASMRYGREILAGLPPFPVLRTAPR